MTRREASTSIRPPKLLQPRPTAETAMPEAPSARISIKIILPEGRIIGRPMLRVYAAAGARQEWGDLRRLLLVLFFLHLLALQLRLASSELLAEFLEVEVRLA